VVAMSQLPPSLILEHGVEEYQELPGHCDQATFFLCREADDSQGADDRTAASCYAGG